MALAHFVIVEVVGWGDLHATGSLLWIGVLVAHNGDGAVAEWQCNLTANQLGQCGMLRMNRDSSIAQHGLRAGGCYCQVLLSGGSILIGNGVVEIPHVAVLLFGDYL